MAHTKLLFRSEAREKNAVSVAGLPLLAEATLTQLPEREHEREASLGDAA